FDPVDESAGGHAERLPRSEDAAGMRSESLVSRDSLASAATESPWRAALRRLRHNQAAMLSLGLLGLMVMFAAFGPYLTSYAYDQVNKGAIWQPPSATHLLGTDALGRDVLARLAMGMRVSLAIGIVATTVSLIIGVAWGAVAGYRGGRTDEWMMRFVDVLYSLPFIF